MKQVSFSIFRKVLSLILGLFLSVSAFAQITVKGQVKDSQGDGIIGANVSEVGTTNGTITDFDGNFVLNCKKGAQLTISFVGYVSQTLQATNNMVVVLQEDAKSLQDVVVIGYGVAKKNDLTGSVTALKPDALNKGLTTNPQDMLQGKIAGVNVTSKGGAPGTKPFCFEADNHSSRLSGGRIARTVLWCVIYTGIVLALIVLYAAIIAKGQGRPLKLDVIKLTMGFSQASGPDKVGYVFLPDGKWVLCYTLYGLLGASVFAASLIGRASWEKTRKYLAEVLGILAAAAVLIYAASRHSTLAWYNTDGYMLKLLGRYVSLMTTMGLLLIFYMIPEDGRLRDGPGSSAKLSNAGFGEVVKNPGLSAGAIVRTLIGAAAGYLIVVLAWKILYRNALGLNMDPNFLAENRGLDLLAFWRIGKGAAVFYMLMILLNAVVRKRKVLYLTLVLCFLLNDLSLFVGI